MSDSMRSVNLDRLNASYSSLFTFFLEAVPSNVVKSRLDERDWSLAIGASEGLDPKA